MTTRAYSRLVMLGAAPETRSSIASVADAYRAHGLFGRWPVDYLATHGDRGLRRNVELAARALSELGFHIGRSFGKGGGAVVHVHTAAGRHFRRDAIFMGAALATGSPLLLHLHGAGFERSEDVALMRWFFQRAACVIAPCESLRAWVRSVERNAHAVCVPHPVALPKAATEPRPNLILFLGRMEPAKGVFDALSAVAALRSVVPDVRLACAGDGDRVGVARYAERLGIADAVKFTGWVGPSGKRALLETAAAFVLPSYEEALPVSLLEAMAAGVPAVVSPVGGIPEVVTDGVSGCIVPPGDTAGLERSLRKLLLDRAHGARLAAAAREVVGLRFAPERALPPLEEIYRSVGLSASGEPTAPRPGLHAA